MNCTSPLISTAALIASVTSLAAEPVEIHSLDGSAVLPGEIVSFDDLTLKVQTGLGLLELARETVKCIGADCPQEVVSEEVVAQAPNAAQLLQSRQLETFPTTDLLMGYGTSLGLSVREADSEYIFGADDKFTVSVSDIENEAVEASFASTWVLAEQGSSLLDESEDPIVVALDALVFATAPTNTLRAISLQDAANIYAGITTNWRDLGGPDADINFFILDNNEGSNSELFNRQILEPFGSELASNVVRINAAGLADLVLSDPNAIVVTKFSQLGDLKQLAVRGECGIQTRASDFTIKTEEYPLTQRIYASSFGQDISEQKTIGDYLLSDRAQAVFRDSNYVDQLFQEVTAEDQGLRFITSVLPRDAELELEPLRELISELVYSDRTSITVRFNSGTSEIEPRAMNDLARLANEIADGKFDKKEILFIGFTDSVGRGDLNEVLSNARANQVKDALLQILPSEFQEQVPFEVQGYGEMMPLACNETETGRRINRRVEIWIRDRA